MNMIKGIAVTIAVVGGLLLSHESSAKLTLDDSKTDVTFMVDGQMVNAVAATEADFQGKQVYRCKPKDSTGKKIFVSDGKSSKSMVECTPVKLVANKSGGTKFKAIKK